MEVRHRRGGGVSKSRWRCYTNVAIVGRRRGKGAVEAAVVFQRSDRDSAQAGRSCGSGGEAVRNKHGEGVTKAKGAEEFLGSCSKCAALVQRSRVRVAPDAQRSCSCGECRA